MPTARPTAAAVAARVAGDEPDLDARPRAARRRPRPRSGWTGSPIAMRPAAAPSIATQTGVAPVGGQRRRRRSARGDVDAALARAAARCRRRPRAAVDRSPVDAAAGDAPRTPVDRPEAELVRVGAARRSPRRADARCRASTDAARSSTSRRARRPPAATTARPSGGPSVSVPVLSKTTVSTRAAASSASPPRMRIPASAPRPVPTMIAVGVARPIAHGQAMIDDADERGQRERQARLRAERAARRRTSAAATTRTSGHEDLADPVGEPLDRRLRALGALDELDDPGERGVAADARRPHDERAGRVDGRADDLVARPPSSTGIGSPVSIDSSTAERALDDDAVDRHPLARPDPEQVAGRRPPRARTSRSSPPSIRPRGRRPGARRAGGSRRRSGPSPGPRASGRAGRGR